MKITDTGKQILEAIRNSETVSGYKSEWYECHNCQMRIDL